MTNRTYIGKQMLPNGYTRLEYIESSGSQYINTGIKPTNNTRVVCDFQLLNSGVGQSVFGAWGFDSNYAVIDAYLLQVQQENYFTNWHGDGLAADFPDSISVTARHLCDKDGRVGKLDSYTATVTASTFSSPYPLYIFGGNLMNSLNQGTAMRLWSTKIYENGALVRDYLPCIAPDGSIGLYDSITSVFYGNAGSGKFAAGATIALNSVAQSINHIYVGVNGVARKVKKAYVGINGVATQWWFDGVKVDKLFGEMSVVRNSSWSNSSAQRLSVDLSKLNEGETAHILVQAYGRFAVHEVTRGSTNFKTVYVSNPSTHEHQTLYIDGNTAYISSDGKSGAWVYAAMLLLVRFPYSPSEVEEFFSKLVIKGSDTGQSTMMPFNLSTNPVSQSNFIVSNVGSGYGFYLWNFETKTLTTLYATGVTPVYIQEGSNHYIYGYSKATNTRGNITGFYHPEI